MTNGNTYKQEHKQNKRKPEQRSSQITVSRHNLVRLQRRRQSDNNRKTCNKNAVIKLTRCTARYTLTNNNRYIYNYNNVLCIYVYKVLNAMQHGENQLSLGQIIVVALHKFYTCLKCVCCAVSRLCKLNKTKIQQKITFTLLHTCILLITKQNAIMLCVCWYQSWWWWW